MEALLESINVDLESVDFKESRFMDCWEKQVPTEIQKSWNELNDREKKLVYLMAKKLEDNYYEALDNQSRASIN